MGMRFEVWCYSNSWGKWIRNVYPNLQDAQKRYEVLESLGKNVRPPQPVNTGLPLFDWVAYTLNKVLGRTKPKKVFSMIK